MSEDKLKVNKLEIQNWMNVQHIVLTLNGESVTLRGENGMGKTAILTAVLAATHGKDAFPYGFDYTSLIRKAADVDKSKVIMDLGDGTKTKIRMKVSVTKSDMYLNVEAFDDDGNKKTVPGGPATFAKKLVGSISFDPQKFKDLPMKEKVAIVYDMCPGLQEELEKFDADRKEQQEARSRINIETKLLDGQLVNTPFDPEVPNKPIDVGAVSMELNAATDHNKKRGVLEENLATREREVTIKKDKLTTIAERIAELQVEQEKLSSDKSFVEAEIKATMIDLDAFIPTDIAPIEERISKINETNEKVLKNKQHSDIKDQLLKKKQEFSNAGEEMKAIEDRKAKALSNHPLPLAGLSIDNGRLMYMDEESFEVRDVELMSSGQFWNFSTSLYCAINPALAFMIVPNLNDLDRSNAEAVVKTAEKHGLQLLSHETIVDKKPVGLQIKITDGNTGIA